MLIHFFMHFRHRANKARKWDGLLRQRNFDATRSLLPAARGRQQTIPGKHLRTLQCVIMMPPNSEMAFCTVVSVASQQFNMAPLGFKQRWLPGRSQQFFGSLLEFGWVNKVLPCHINTKHISHESSQYECPSISHAHTPRSRKPPQSQAAKPPKNQCFSNIGQPTGAAKGQSDSGCQVT